VSYKAARAAADAKLVGVRDELQTSFQDLVLTMCAVGRQDRAE
jgi:hypothetical protein